MNQSLKTDGAARHTKKRKMALKKADLSQSASYSLSSGKPVITLNKVNKKSSARRCKNIFLSLRSKYIFQKSLRAVIHIHVYVQDLESNIPIFFIRNTFTLAMLQGI